jgi:hypothetical protein
MIFREWLTKAAKNTRLGPSQEHEQGHSLYKSSHLFSITYGTRAITGSGF